MGPPLRRRSRTAFLLVLVLVPLALYATLERAAQTQEPALGFRFENVGPQAGLTAVTVLGGREHNKYLLETTGCGAAFLAYDGDGGRGNGACSGPVKCCGIPIGPDLVPCQTQCTGCQRHEKPTGTGVAKAQAKDSSPAVPAAVEPITTDPLAGRPTRGKCTDPLAGSFTGERP